jgi:hypothetical protein
VTAHSGQFFTYAIGKQTGEGTAQTTPKYKGRVTGGAVVPQPQVIDLPETDSSIQRSRSVKVGQLVGGAFEKFVRTDEYAFLAYGALGANSTSGAGPYTHTATANGAPPFFTIYSAYDTTALVDRYVDCRITELVTRGGGGQALGVTATFLGKTSTHGETDPVATPSAVEPLVYPHVTVTFDSVTTDIVESFEITSAKVGIPVQGDTGMSVSAISLGRWAVTGRMRVLFETDAIWRKWITASGVGTTPSQTLYTAPLTILASRTATSDQITWTMTAVELRAVTLVPDPAGNPLFYDIEWSAQPQATIANTLAVETKNLIATY